MNREIKILLVEDDELSSLIIQKILKSLGYKISAAVQTGEAALGAVSASCPDLILMDIMLKDGLDGIKTASIIKARFDIPIIYVTGLSDAETLNRAKATEPHGYIIKPVTERELHTNIEIALYKHNAEKEIETSKKALRALSARIESIREEEKTRIAREIHDELGQTLTCMKIDAIWLERKLSEDALRNKAISLIDTIDSTIKTVRKISSDLRPGVIDKLGLLSAIEWQTKEFSKRTGTKCVLNLPVENIKIDPQRSIAIFRIFQESLTNISKHSDATIVEISVSNINSLLCLEISDNGKGLFNSEKLNSFGIIGMKERAIAFGGILTVQNNQGQGVTVKLKLPLIQYFEENSHENNNHRRPQACAQRA
ncbi:MAG TPA: response regulator [Ignavibacteria bacterium]|nr:response regulator [Ignavibacteria bacterium]